MTPPDRNTFLSARSDFGVALGTVQRLRDMGMLMARIEHIGHFMVSIARCERTREPRPVLAAPEPAREVE